MSRHFLKKFEEILEHDWADEFVVNPRITKLYDPTVFVGDRCSKEGT